MEEYGHILRKVTGQHLAEVYERAAYGMIIGMLLNNLAYYITQEYLLPSLSIQIRLSGFLKCD